MNHCHILPGLWHSQRVVLKTCKMCSQSISLLCSKFCRCCLCNKKANVSLKWLPGPTNLALASPLSASYSYVAAPVATLHWLHSSHIGILAVPWTCRPCSYLWFLALPFLCLKQAASRYLLS